MCLDTMYHFLVPDLPFGGVGESGMGSYNGKTSFETFSHNRSVFDRSLLPGIVDTLINQRFPPYTGMQYAKSHCNTFFRCQGRFAQIGRR